MRWSRANGCICDICILLFLYYSYDYPSTGMVIGGEVGLMAVFVTFVLCRFYITAMTTHLRVW